MSTITRMLGRGGKMYSFWAMNSLRMSACSVPVSWSGATPCFSATATYIASSIAAGELMVIDVLTLSSGMPANRISMSSRDVTATPHFPTSPRDSGWSGSRPMSVGRSKATDRPWEPWPSRYLNRSLVWAALPKPANWRMVQGLPRYIVLWTPRVNGNSPGSARSRS